MDKARNYNVKDVEMLMTAATLIENAIANKTFLQSKRVNWGDSYFEEIKTRIDIAIQTHLGIDGAKELRQATQEVSIIQLAARKDLAEVKVQIEEDFKSEPEFRDEILKQLGFTTYMEGVRNNSQESMINLLFQFKTNLNENLKAAIIDKGTAAATLEAIIAQADALAGTNVFQETQKGNRKNTTIESITEFNAVYDTVISISRIAQNFYKQDPTIKEQFSFIKIAKTLKNNRATKAREAKAER